MSRGTRLARTAAIAAAVLGVPFLVLWYGQVRRWGAVQTGSLNSPGTPPNYNFFSGFGSIILPPLLNGLVVGLVFWWHHQCHVTGCYWYARRKTAAGEPACWRHHPERGRTVADLHQAHHEARERGAK